MDHQLLKDFLEYIENNYYYNSGGWINVETDKWKSKDELIEEFLLENSSF